MAQATHNKIVSFIWGIEEIRKDILAIEKEAGWLLDELLKGGLK